jgi:hypothetical protein
MGTHRFIGIWFVVVEERVFVRSWSVKPDGWYRAFLSESRGVIKVGDYETCGSRCACEERAAESRR